MKGDASDMQNSSADNEKNAQSQPGDITAHKNSRRENWITMLFCIVAAVCIWFYVMSIDSPSSTETFSSVPVAVLNNRDASQESLTAISGTGSVIDVTLKGRKRVLNDLSADDIEASVDVSATTVSGKSVFTVNVEAPAGTIVEDFYPKQITVYMDKKGIISVPVECRLIDYTIPSDHSLNVSEPTSLSVNAVQVSGPESELEKIAKARMTLSLGGAITQSFSGTAPLELLDDNGSVITSRYLTLSSTEATASYSVYTTRYLPLTVEYRYGYYDENGTTVTIEPSSVLVRGVVEKLNTMTSHSIATLDETKITEDGSHVYDLNLPEGIELVDAGEQNTVSVNIHLSGSSLKKVTVPANQINIINVPQGKHVEVLADSIVISVRGSTPGVSYLRPEDITVTADVSLVGSNGDQYISVSAALKNGNSANLYAVGEYTLQVRVEDDE